MADIVIKDFRGGLDTRKFLLSQPAGTLTVGNNIHINQGGEAEKRKAWIRLANASGAVNTSLPAGTFGLQPIATGHLIFGSNDGAALTFPASFTYQRLQHPAVLNGTAYNAALHAMTAIVTSEIYGGLAFAVAQFADGNSFCYYNGTLIDDNTSGVILAYLSGSDAKIATAIVNLINKTASYTATQRGVTNQLDVFGLPGALYNTAIVKTSSKGTLTAQLLNNGLANVAGVQAVGQFQIVTGSAGVANFISSVKVNGVETLLNAASILFTTDQNTTASLVANSISGNAATSGYYAVANANLVSIISLTAGTNTNGYAVVVTAAGNVCIGTCAFTLGGTSTGGVTSVTSNAVLGQTTNRAHALFVATLTIGAHTFLAAETVTVSGMGDARYNGSFVLTAVTATTISFNTSTSFTEAIVADTAGSIVYTTGTNLCGGAVAGTSNGLNALATAVAAAINANTVATNYLANSVGATVYVSKKATSSADLPVSIAVVGGTGITISAVAGATQIGLTAYTLQIASTASIFNNNLSRAASSQSVSVIIGGVTNPPFSFLWTLVSDDVNLPGKIKPSDKTAQTITFNYAGGDPELFTAPGGGTIRTPYTIKSTWKCIITDSATTPNTFVTANIDIIVTVTAGI